MNVRDQIIALEGNNNRTFAIEKNQDLSASKTLIASSGIFSKLISAAERNPVKTSLLCATVLAVGSALFVIGSLVALTAAAFFALIDVGMITIDAIALKEIYSKNQLNRALNELELAGCLSIKESAELKKLVLQSASNEEICSQLIQLLQNKFTAEEIAGFSSIKGLIKIQLAVSAKKLNDMQKELSHEVSNLEPSSHKEAMNKAIAQGNRAAFQKAAMSHYCEVAEKYKSDHNMVLYFKNREYAEKIQEAGSLDSFLTFIRLSRQEKIFAAFDQKLRLKIKDLETTAHAIGKLESKKPANQKEIDTKIATLKKLQADFNTQDQQLDTLFAEAVKTLQDYSFMSEKVDYLFAIYRGNYKQKLNYINELLKTLYPQYKKTLKDLPLHPGDSINHASPLAQISPLEKVNQKIAEQEAKLKDCKDNVKLQKGIASLKRTRADIETVKKSRSQESQAKDSLDKSATNLSKKSIVIFPCSFGTGHKTAANALKEQIGSAAEVKIIDPTDYEKGFLVPETDWVYKFGQLLGQKWSSTKAFNWILQEQKYWMVNLENKIDRFYRGLFRLEGKNGVAPALKGIDSSSKKLIRLQFLLERPDLAITTYHMDLNPLTEVAEELGLPLLHLPTDLDVKMREVFGNKQPTYPHFNIFLPDFNPLTMESIKPLPLTSVHIDKNNEVAGIAFRPEFYIQRSQDEVAAIKREKGIDPNATVILVLSGGNGQEVPYPEMLLKSKDNGKKYHMIVVAGGNKNAGDSLNKKRAGNNAFINGKSPNVTMEVAEDPFAATTTQPYYIGGCELSRLHAISDVAISKPGGLSIGELLQTGVPIIPDKRMTPMEWEEFNIDVLRNKNRGIPYTGDEDFLTLIDQVKELGKKPENHRFELFIRHMARMIHEVEDSTDPTMKQRRCFLKMNIDSPVKQGVSG